MILSKRTVLTIVTVLILLHPLISITKPSTLARYENFEEITQPKSEYYDTLTILNDTDFETLNFEGNGSEASPYLIKDYVFYPDFYIGIYIANTTKYCVITNCTIPMGWYGIFLWNASNIRVSNNIVNYCSIGIVASDCSDVEVVKNTLTYSSQKAVYIVDTPNTLVEDNFIQLTTYMGIELLNSPNSFVNNNSLIHCDEGIALFDSQGTAVINNQFYLGGITLHSSSYKLEDYLSYTLENNTLNSRNIGFFKNLKANTFSDDIYSQLILVNCTDIAIFKLNFTDCVTGVVVYYGKNIEVSECSFTQNFEGSILMFFVEHARVHSSSFSENTRYPGGVALIQCIDGGVVSNIFEDCERGIMFIDTDICTASDNYCKGNYESGIYLSNVTRSFIYNNVIEETKRLDSSGIVIINSNQCTILENTITENLNYGIGLYNSNSCTIKQNAIISNAKYGVYLDYKTSNNVIYWNEFIDNYPVGVLAFIVTQASDSGTKNTWYSVALKEGNYWNEHRSKEPYDIDGEAESQDLYPLRKSPLKTGFIIPFLTISLALIIISRIRKKRSL